MDHDQSQWHPSSSPKKRKENDKYWDDSLQEGNWSHVQTCQRGNVYKRDLPIELFGLFSSL